MALGNWQHDVRPRAARACWRPCSRSPRPLPGVADTAAAPVQDRHHRRGPYRRHAGEAVGGLGPRGAAVLASPGGAEGAGRFPGTRRRASARRARRRVFGEVVLVSVPYKALPDIGRDLKSELAGKVVLDTCNPYPERDGPMAVEVRQEGTGVASPRFLPGVRLVRAFNAIGWRDLEHEAHRKGELIAIPLAGDDPQALAVAQQLVTDAGFAPVVVGGPEPRARVRRGHDALYAPADRGPAARGAGAEVDSGRRRRLSGHLRESPGRCTPSAARWPSRSPRPGALRLRVIQRSHPHEDQVRPGFGGREHRGTAERAEAAAHDDCRCRRASGSRVSVPSTCNRRGGETGVDRAAAGAQVLAYAAPALADHDRLGTDAVAHCLAQAASGHWHGTGSAQEGERGKDSASGERTGETDPNQNVQLNVPAGEMVGRSGARSNRCD